MMGDYFLLRVNFNDLLLLCFCTALLLLTNVSFLALPENDSEFSSSFSTLSLSRPSHETHLLTVVFANDICLAGNSLLGDPGCDDDDVSTASSVCVELSFVVLTVTGGESDVDNLSLFELTLLHESCLPMLGSHMEDTD